MSYFVRMTDKFMSGWGEAKGRTNVHVIQCDTLEQAETIERAANKRPEMLRVAITLTMPRARAGVVYTVKHWNDLGAIWHKG